MGRAVAVTLGGDVSVIALDVRDRRIVRMRGIGNPDKLVVRPGR